MKYKLILTGLLFLCVGTMPCYAQEQSFDLKGAFQTLKSAGMQNNNAEKQENKQTNAEPAKENLTENNSVGESSANTFTKPIIMGSIIKDLEETGQAVIHLEFELGRASVLPAHEPAIEEIYTGLTTHPEWKLRIEGHTDSSGKPDWNKKLSLKRAEAIQNVLIEKGIEEDRLTCIGFGSEKPLNSENTEEAHQQNRRVELHVE